MANDIISTIAQSFGKLDDERQQEIQNLKRQIQKLNEEVSALRELVVKLIGKHETHKVAGIWDPDKYILSTDKRLWEESGLFRSQWAFQYAVRELGCPFVAANGCKRKRVCKASVLEKWLNNSEVREIMDKTEKMRRRWEK